MDAPVKQRPLVAVVLCLALTPVLGAETSAPAADAPPAWAYPVNPPDFKPAVDDGSLRHVPDSAQAHTLSQLRDFFMAPDWHPGDHPVMPGVVASGRRPDVFACGFCHRADGSGGPENASLFFRIEAASEHHRRRNGPGAATVRDRMAHGGQAGRRA
jgi:hypothetical protein